MSLEEPRSGYELCDACGAVVKCTQQKNVFDDGIEFDFTGSGYYGGFIDNFPPDDTGKTMWRMCHDCVVKFLQTFPMLAQKLDGMGCHPSDADKPCCKWAWRIGEDGNVEHGSDEMEWVKR